MKYSKGIVGTHEDKYVDGNVQPWLLVYSILIYL